MVEKRTSSLIGIEIKEVTEQTSSTVLDYAYIYYVYRMDYVSTGDVSSNHSEPSIRQISSDISNKNLNYLNKLKEIFLELGQVVTLKPVLT